MSDTPRTDATHTHQPHPSGGLWVPIELCRTLERELRNCETDAATMREAIEQNESCHLHSRETCSCSCGHALRDALATSAGRELLAEFDQLRERNDALAKQLAQFNGEDLRLQAEKLFMRDERDAALAEVERLRGWHQVALQLQSSPAGTDISTPEKYRAAEANAKCELLDELATLRRDLVEVRKLIAIAAKAMDSIRDFPCGHKPNGVSGKCEACAALDEWDVQRTLPAPAQAPGVTP